MSSSFKNALIMSILLLYLLRQKHLQFCFGFFLFTLMSNLGVFTRQGLCTYYFHFWKVLSSYTFTLFTTSLPLHLLQEFCWINHVFNIFFPFFLVVPVLELRTACLLGKHFTTWTTPLGHFTFSYFSDRVWSFCTGPALDCDLPTYASWVAEITDIHHHAQLACWGKVSLTLLQGCPWTAILPISATWECGITGMSHCIWLQSVCLWQPI
jgi:hypothetical protein